MARHAPCISPVIDRFQHANRAGSAVMSPHKVLIISFRQTVIDIWDVPPELLLEDGAVQRYGDAFTALHERVENSILNEICGHTNAAHGHPFSPLSNGDDRHKT